MKKTLVALAALIGIGVLIQRWRVALPRVDWEQRIERMPDNAPPKWMFRSISAIRENTERILELLERGRDTPVDASDGTPGV